MTIVERPTNACGPAVGSLGRCLEDHYRRAVKTFCRLGQVAKRGINREPHTSRERARGRWGLIYNISSIYRTLRARPLKARSVETFLAALYLNSVPTSFFLLSPFVCPVRRVGIPIFLSPFNLAFRSIARKFPRRSQNNINT